MDCKEETLIPELLAELGNHLKSAINQADPFCDVVFKVGSGNEQEIFHAHRVILAYRCAYFRAMFSSGLSESTQKEITLSDVNPQAFKSILEYLYSGNLTITTENLVPLLQLSNFYDLPLPKKMCSLFVKKHLSIENVCAFFESASLFQADELKKECLAFIEENALELFSSKNHLSLSRTCMVDILKSNFLDIEIEKLVFDAAHEWFKVNCLETQDSSFSNDHCKEFWNNVRFPLIPLNDILEIEKLKVVPVDLLSDAFKYHAIARSELHKEDLSKHFHKIQTTPRTSRKPKAVIFGVASPSVSLINGNKTASSNAPEGRTVLGNTSYSSGIHSWTVYVNTLSFLMIGVSSPNVPINDLSNYYIGKDGLGWGFYSDGKKYHQSHGQAYTSFFSVGDRITVTLNMDNHTLSFAKNGNPLGVAFSNLPSIPLVPAVTLWNSTVVTLEN